MMQLCCVIQKLIRTAALRICAVYPRSSYDRRATQTLDLWGLAIVYFY